MRQTPSFFLLFATIAACDGTVIYMPRSDYDHTVVTCRKGINQQVHDADPVEECADARNVWAPDGRAVQRPGYVGIVSTIEGGTASAGGFFGRTEDTSAGTFTNATGAGALTLSNLVGRVADGGDMDRWYVGHTSTFNNARFDLTTPNSNATSFKAEYWNGESWVHLNVTESTGGSQLSHLNDTPSVSGVVYFVFVAPQDWATTSVNSQSAYWIRFNLLEANIDAATQVDITISSGRFALGSFRGVLAPQFTSNKRYLFVIDYASDAGVVGYLSSSDISLKSFVVNTRGAMQGNEPAVMAVVPQLEEAFVAYGYDVTVHKAFPASSTATKALVEAGDFAVGPGAPYDRTLIAQSSSFPAAKYIEFFKNRLWAANLLGAPGDVQWSGVMPFHKVWPLLSQEPLVENDNSPITGMRGFHEHMTVFKNDSIFIMPSLGLNEFDLEEFDVVRVVAGTGCVSNSSIREVRNQLIFLAEDGIYSFNGVNVKKLSDRIEDTISRITPGRRPFATAAHWRTNSLYLLAVSLDGSDANDHVLVYDYKNLHEDGTGSWWIWDNIEAQHWLEDEGAYDDEALYFGDSQSRIYQMGVGKTDHGGTINSYVTTQRLGYGERARKQIREVRVHGDSQFTTAVIGVYPDDQATAQQEQTLDFSDPYETVNSRPLVRRHRRADVRVNNDWVQVKLSNSTKNTELVMAGLDIGQRRLGHR